MSEAVADTADTADARCMRAFAAGDLAAFEQLYATHKGGLFRYFLRSLANRGLAEELAQDVWTSVIRTAADWRPDAKFTTWLYRLAHNRLIDHYRRSNLVVFTALEEEDEASSHAHEVPSAAPSPEEATDQRAAARQAVRLVEALPPAQREALLLQLEGGLSLEEIAAATGAGFETVKSRLRYALARVREGLKEFQ
jgi:RNA polymerase sigma factor (sigma-70 family)